MGLTLGVTKHRSGRHLMWWRRRMLSPSSNTFAPSGFTISRVIPSAASEQRLRRDFRKSFYTCLSLFNPWFRSIEISAIHPLSSSGKGNKYTNGGVHRETVKRQVGFRY